MKRVDENMMIDLNEEFDRHDAYAEVFFAKHPPRVVYYNLAEPYELMIQFSLLEGIWVELNYPSENDYATCCEDVVEATFCLKDAMEELEKWLKENGYESHVEYFKSWLPQNWKWYGETQKNHARRPISSSARYEEHIEKVMKAGLESLKKSDRLYNIQDYYRKINFHNSCIGHKFRYIFGNGREPPENELECFFYEQDECDKHVDYDDLRYRKCSFKSMERRMRCGMYKSWKGYLDNFKN